MKVTLHPSLINLLQNYSAPIQNSTNINSMLKQFDEPEDRTQEPITSKDDINRIVEFYLNKKQFRNAMLVVLGMNFGIRISDLAQIKFSQVIDSNTGKVKDSFLIYEEKTGKKNRVWINNACKKIILLYLYWCKNNEVEKDLQDYLFVSESNHKEWEEISYVADGIPCTKKIQSPLTYNSFPPILKDACKKLGITGKHNTHCLRKTFAWGVLDYYQSIRGEDYSGRGLMFLQKRFKHSSTLVTEHYTGITNKEDEQVCMSLNLGMEAIDKWLATRQTEI